MVIDVNYFSRVFRRIIIILFTILGVYLSFKLAIFYLPFLVSFIISLLLEPIIRFLMNKIKLKRKVSAIIVMTLIIIILVGLLSWLIFTIISEGTNLLNNLNYYFSSWSNSLNQIIDTLKSNKLKIPESVINMLSNITKDLFEKISVWSESFLNDILKFVSNMPTIGIYIVITILSLYFICTDKVYMIDQVEHHIPEAWTKKLYKHIKNLIKELGSYLKSEAILILISFLISLVGLYIFHFVGLNIKYPLLYAIGIGFVDALPILGSGTIMIPWSIIAAFNGDVVLGIAVFILWIVMSVVRQIIEPKVVSKHIGIHPIFTLIAMYTGFKFTGILGLFIGPIVLIILKDIFSSVLDKGVIKSIFSREVE